MQGRFRSVNALAVTGKLVYTRLEDFSVEARGGTARGRSRDRAIGELAWISPGSLRESHASLSRPFVRQFLLLLLAAGFQAPVHHRGVTAFSATPSRQYGAPDSEPFASGATAPESEQCHSSNP